MRHHARDCRNSPRQKSAGPAGRGHYPPDHQPCEGRLCSPACSSWCRGHGCWICSQAAASWASRLCPRCQKLPLCGPLRRGTRRCEGQLQNGRVDRQSDIRQGEAESFLANIRGPFDLALLDPPFHHDTVAAVLPLLAAKIAPAGSCSARPSARPTCPAGGRSDAGEAVQLRQDQGQPL